MVTYILQQECGNSRTPFTMTIDTLKHIQDWNKQSFRKFQRRNYSIPLFRCIQSPVKHVKWSVLQKCSILDVWQGSKYALEVFYPSALPESKKCVKRVAAISYRLKRTTDFKNSFQSVFSFCASEINIKKYSIKIVKI